ncbi:MAG: hypothetical protein LC674_07560, partial [Actinobacteria bacterium]|nr:hypothetical protein [Actinomycetota bacterium]
HPLIALGSEVVNLGDRVLSPTLRTEPIEDYSKRLITAPRNVCKICDHLGVSSTMGNGSRGRI